MHIVSMVLTSATFHNQGYHISLFHLLLQIKIAFRLYEKRWLKRLALVPLMQEGLLVALIRQKKNNNQIWCLSLLTQGNGSLGNWHGRWGSWKSWELLPGVTHSWLKAFRHTVLMAQEWCRMGWWEKWGRQVGASLLLKCQQSSSETKHSGGTVSLTLKSIRVNQI